MLTLFHHPFCPHSRFIRLALAEHGLEHRAIEERVWERREDFLMLNPAATTPVLVAEGYPPVPGAAVIAEFLDETSGAELHEHRLMPTEPAGGSRCAGWPPGSTRSSSPRSAGPLVTGALLQAAHAHRAGRRSARHRRDPCGADQCPLSFCLYRMAGAHPRLAGRRPHEPADLAAAAHLSAVDYLGDVPWTEDEASKNWYARVKSRPSFRPMLAETWPGLAPAPNYADLDF